MEKHRSIFDPQNDDDAQLRGGLDRFLGPPARAYSHMPGDLIDGEVEDDADPDVEARDPEAGRDNEQGTWANPDEPVNEIRQALDEKLATEPPPTASADPESHAAD